MDKHALKEAIQRLPVEEQIELLGDVWDEIAADAESVPVPAWHLDELERRLANDDPEFIPWAEVRQRLAGESAG